MQNIKQCTQFITVLTLTIFNLSFVCSCFVPPSPPPHVLQTDLLHETAPLRNWIMLAWCSGLLL